MKHLDTPFLSNSFPDSLSHLNLALSPLFCNSLSFLLPLMPGFYLDFSLSWSSFNIRQLSSLRLWFSFTNSVSFLSFSLFSLFDFDLSLTNPLFTSFLFRCFCANLFDLYPGALELLNSISEIQSSATVICGYFKLSMHVISLDFYKHKMATTVFPSTQD